MSSVLGSVWQGDSKSNRKIPGFRNHVCPIRNPDVGRSVVAGPTRERPSERGLEKACLFFLRAESCFLGRFVEDMGDRLTSEVAVAPRMGRLGHDHNSDRGLGHRRAL